ncbi:MAG: alpha/beta hydrolase [Chloroflexi bacterium]|nr:alpha/beta hydrolase [Chloroflexota bacterium]
MNLLPGVTSHYVQTSRLKMHYLDYGPDDGIPAILIHGNLSTGRFYEHIMPNAPAGYRFIMPDMRGFGDTERLPIDATRGLRDWADDTYALVQALGITQPVHLSGWSTGGAAVAAYAMDRPAQVASLTFIDPVSPYGFGGMHVDGTPCYPDYAGSGGGTGNPDFAQRIANGDRSSESPLSPRNVINSSYWAASHREPAEREDMIVDELLKSVTGDDGYPGDFTPSANWPGIAPGTRGILNALSGKYCNWAGIVDITPKPPILWVHGSADIVVADGSAWEMGTLGKMGIIPGWPGDAVFPPQMMVTQIRNVLQRYADQGGSVQMEMFEGSGHGPVFDAAQRFSDTFFRHISK